MPCFWLPDRRRPRLQAGILLGYELGGEVNSFDDRLRLNADVFFVNYYHRLFEVENSSELK